MANETTAAIISRQGSGESPLRAFQILRNFGSLTVGKTLGDGCTFFLFIILSRAFGQEGVGQYSFAMALTGFFVAFADFGLYNLSIKEMSRRADSLGDYYGRIFALRLILSATVFLAVAVLLPIFSFPAETKLIIVLIAAYQVIYTLLDGFAAVFVAHEDMHVAGLLEFLLRAVTALACIAVVIAGGSLVTTLAMFPVVTIGYVLIAYAIVVRKYGRLQFSMSWPFLTRTLREAVPYALFMFLRQLSTRVDVVFLGVFLGAAAAGVYNVAYRIVFLLMMSSYFVGLALFPLASRLYANLQHKELGALYHQALNLAVLIGLPTASGLWLVAPHLITLVFGETFAESALVLRYLAWLVFLALLKSIMGIFLTACDRQIRATKGQWMAAWLNVLGNVVLIPTLGVRGAAVTTLISEMFLVVFFAVWLKDLFGWPSIRSRLAISSMATAAFCLTFTALPSQPLGVVFPASALLYIAILLLFKEIRQNEMRSLIGLLRRG